MPENMAVPKSYGKELRPMAGLTLPAAQKLIAVALDKAREMGLKPLAVAVLDERGAMKAFAAEEGTSLKRGEIAQGKAHGTLALGMGGRAIAKRVQEQLHFLVGVAQVAAPVIPMPGGVLIRDGEGRLLGAVGVSGDTSDNDEAVALAGIEAAGYVADSGAS
jgi:uncharacterized protein GlcG (DUF336 family)